MIRVAAVFFALASAVQAQTPAVDTAARQSILDGVLRETLAGYVDSTAAVEMDRVLRAHDRAGAYDGIMDATAFADTLTAHLQTVRPDRHLRVRYSADPLPDYQNAPEGDDADLLDQARQDNYGFRRVEILAGNVGYVALGVAYPTTGAFAAEARAVADAAAALLARTEAVVIDLRDAPGGMSQNEPFAGHLVAERTLMNTLRWRVAPDGRLNAVDSVWTVVPGGGPRLATQPVYVLTSARTFSAAEALAYALQASGRAIVVGEPSRGGANPGGRRRVTDHVYVWVPTGTTVNPVTGTNWEGTGVVPDAPTSAADALRTAHVAALRRLRAATASPDRQANIDHAITVAEQTGHP